MQLRIVTYNLRHNAAFKNLLTIITEHQPEVLMVQEFEYTEAALHELEEAGYALSGYSHSFLSIGRVFGVATFYKHDTLSPQERFSFDLPMSVHELMKLLLDGGNHTRTVNGTVFTTQNNKQVIVINVHLSAFATNAIRIRQLRKTFTEYSLKHKQEMPVIIAGDINYAYNHTSLQQLLTEFSVTDATQQVEYTSIQKYLGFVTMKVKLDYVFTKNCQNSYTVRLEHLGSDHFPVMSDIIIQ